MNCLPRTDFIQNYITANNLDRCREISSDFAKMNSSAYVCTLEFIFAESAQASRISKIGLPVVLLIIKTRIVHVTDNLSTVLFIQVQMHLCKIDNTYLFAL